MAQDPPASHTELGSPPAQPLDIGLFREQLAAWYHTRRRRLPWREEPTPYRVWVSEIMLQQTQVATVIPYFERFVAAFPDVASLAAADEQDVLGLWAGLGYYRRCRHLHRAAREVVDRFGGELPRTARELLKLPGVGRYTAGAIASIAFGDNAPALDGNVVRVLARVLALELPVDGAAGQRVLWDTAAALVDPADPSSHNQAMIELGALVCAPRTPGCPTCPVREGCIAGSRGDAVRFPHKRPRRRPTVALAVAGLLRDPGGRLLLARRPDGALLGGLWELPGGEIAPRSSRKQELARWLSERARMRVTVGPHLASVEHTFSHRLLTTEVYAVRGAGVPVGPPQWYTDVRWTEPSEVGRLPLSRLTTKVLAAVGYDPPGTDAPGPGSPGAEDGR